jgi:hypothetical protein
MNSQEIISSTPNTIQNYNNYLKDYVNTSGFQWDSTCLDVAFKNLGNNFEKYVQKVGDYNTVTATNPEYTPPRSYQEKDYSKKCPEGWTETNNGWNTTCKNLNYIGQCAAGRTKSTPSKESCPIKTYGDPAYKQTTESVTNYIKMTTFFTMFGTPYTVYGDNPGTMSKITNWKIPPRISYTPYTNSKIVNKPNNYHYTGWYGPTDASQGDFNNTNIGIKIKNEGSYCHAGWAANNSLDGARLDCQNSGGTWVNYYDDPGFWRHGYTCYKPNKYNYVTESSSSFFGYTDEQKRNWENNCKAYWPMKTINIPGKWTCTYGEKLENDIANGRIFQIGFANSPIEAAKIILKSNRLKDNYFFMLDNRIYIIGINNDVGIFTNKGFYQPNCTELNNQKGTLYFISQEFFKMLEQCKIVNDKINDVNKSRNILQNAISSYKENFIGGSKNKQIIENLAMSTEEITKNQNEITANLVNNYNKKAELYNYQIDLIGNNEKLVEDHNKKINKQFDDLNAIQEQIALKDRVIELNEELTKKQIRNKKILIGFFVLLPFLGIPLLLVILKIFNPFAGLGLAALIVIGYIIYILVINNQSAIKKFGRENKKIISKYEKSLSNYWNKEKEKLSQSLSKFINGNCYDDDKTDEKPEENTRNTAYPRGDYLMKSNGPLYYYDGSAPPQQIYPGAVGSIEFNIEGQNMKFPKEINEYFNKIKNPITQFFFVAWWKILDNNNNGISLNDPRFNEVLDIIDFPDSEQNISSFWEDIKLPIVTNINQQFDYLFQSYSGGKRDLSKTASSFIVNLWNFVFGDIIPGDIYESWVNKLAKIIKKNNPNIQKFYEEYFKELTKMPKFTDKYGNIDKFHELKIVEFVRIINQDINVSQPFSKKYVP